MPLDSSWLLPPAPVVSAGLSARSAMRVLPGLNQAYQGVVGSRLEMARGIREAEAFGAAQNVLPSLLELDALSPTYAQDRAAVLRQNPGALYDRAVNDLLGLQTEERRYNEMYGEGREAKDQVQRDRERRDSIRRLAMDTDDWSLHSDYNTLVNEGFDADQAFDFVADQAALRASLLKQAGSGIPKQVLLEDPEFRELIESNKGLAGKFEAAVASADAKKRGEDLTATQQASLVQSLKQAVEDAEAGGADDATLNQLRQAHSTAVKSLAASVSGGTPAKKTAKDYLSKPAPDVKQPTRPLTGMGR